MSSPGLLSHWLNTRGLDSQGFRAIIQYSRLMKMPQHNYALIGDVHSQPGPLLEALDHCYYNKLTPILLGDLFDSRCDTSDSVAVYKAVRDAQSSFPGMVVLRSNHQDKLERYLKGNNVRIFQDLRQTLSDFEEGGIDTKGELLPWLLSFPYGIVFRDSAGMEYRCSHACFPSQLEVPEYDDRYLVKEATRKERDLMMFGPSYPTPGGPNERVFWWNKEPNRTWVRVAGHYHAVHISDYNLVLDGQMGGSSRDPVPPSEMNLCLYSVEDKALKLFPLVY